MCLHYVLNVLRKAAKARESLLRGNLNIVSHPAE